MIAHDLLCPRSIRAKGIQRVCAAAHVGETRKVNSCLSQLLIDRCALGIIRQDGVADFFVPFFWDRRILPKTRIGMSHRLRGHDQGALRSEGAQKRLDDRLRTSDQIAERPERSVQHDGISPLQPQLSEQIFELLPIKRKLFSLQNIGHMVHCSSSFCARMQIAKKDAGLLAPAPFRVILIRKRQNLSRFQLLPSAQPCRQRILRLYGSPWQSCPVCR